MMNPQICSKVGLNGFTTITWLWEMPWLSISSLATCDVTRPPARPQHRLEEGGIARR